MTNRKLEKQIYKDILSLMLTLKIDNWAYDQGGGYNEIIPNYNFLRHDKLSYHVYSYPLFFQVEVRIFNKNIDNKNDDEYLNIFIFKYSFFANYFFVFIKL